MFFKRTVLHAVNFKLVMNTEAANASVKKASKNFQLMAFVLMLTSVRSGIMKTMVRVWIAGATLPVETALVKMRTQCRFAVKVSRVSIHWAVSPVKKLFRSLQQLRKHREGTQDLTTLGNNAALVLK